MTLPPWFGEPGGWNEPDPLIWWIVAPVAAYVWAIFVAALISCAIEIRRWR